MDTASLSIAASPSRVAPSQANRWDWSISWVFICGTIASGAFRWPISASLTWLVLWFLADPLTGALANAIDGIRWAQERARQQPSLRPAWRLPYARPRCPAERLAVLGSIAIDAWPRVGRAILLALAAIAASAALVATIDVSGVRGIWLLGPLLTLFAGLLPSHMTCSVTAGARAAGAWLVGFAGLRTIGLAPCATAGVIGLGLMAASFAERGRGRIARELGRLAGWGMVVWFALAHQPLIAALAAAAALYWEEATQADRVTALGAWHLTWLASALLAALALPLWMGWA